MTVGAILSALAAIPQILKYVQLFAEQVTLWCIEHQTNETLTEIADAAAMSSRAKTQEERLHAAKLWQDALSRSRISKS